MIEDKLLAESEKIKTFEYRYVSENINEAHNLFREIYTIAVVSEDKVEQIVEKIKDRVASNKFKWFWFKREIIAEYVINENMWRYKDYELIPLWEKINSLWCESTRDEKLSVQIEKLKSYCSGIYVIPKSTS